MGNLDTKILETKFTKDYFQLLSEYKHIPGIVANLNTKNRTYQIGISEFIGSHDYIKNIEKLRPLNFMIAEFPLIYLGIVPKKYAGHKPEHSEYKKLKNELDKKKESFQKILENFIPNGKFYFRKGDDELITTSMKEWKGHGGPCLVNNLSNIGEETLKLLPFKIQLIEHFRNSINAKIKDIYYEIIL